MTPAPSAMTSAPSTAAVRSAAMGHPRSSAAAGSALAKGMVVMSMVLMSVIPVPVPVSSTPKTADIIIRTAIIVRPAVIIAGAHATGQQPDYAEAKPNPPTLSRFF